MESWLKTDKQARIDYLINKTGEPLRADLPGLTEAEAIELHVLLGASKESAVRLVRAARIKGYAPE